MFLPVFKKRGYVVILFLRYIIIAIEYFESIPIIPVQFIAGAKPHKAIAILNDRFHIGLRQSLISTDYVEIIIIQPISGYVEQQHQEENGNSQLGVFHILYKRIIWGQI